MLSLKARTMFFVICALLGCHQRHIKVVDEHSSPLANAEITILTASTASPTVFSDNNGNVQIPGMAGELVLRVVLTGYETAYINISSKIPAVVKLIPAPALQKTPAPASMNLYEQMNPSGYKLS